MGLHAAVKPIETLFVVDAMTGQDAANTAKAINEALPLTGVILTKADGDARGGAAQSIEETKLRKFRSTWIRQWISLKANSGKRNKAPHRTCTSSAHLLTPPRQ